MRPRLLVVAALALAPAAVEAGSPLRLVPQTRSGRLGVEGCTASRDCAEWVRFPATPPRSLVETRFSRSGAHFYVWSKADGHPRDLDVFETPSAGQAPARRAWHRVPGAGGELHWLEGERLWHDWGCGTSCVIAQLTDLNGRVVTEQGSWAEVSHDARRALVADYGGSVVLFDAPSM